VVGCSGDRACALRSAGDLVPPPPARSGALAHARDLRAPAHWLRVPRAGAARPSDGPRAPQARAGDPRRRPAAPRARLGSAPRSPHPGGAQGRPADRRAGGPLPSAARRARARDDRRARTESACAVGAPQRDPPSTQPAVGPRPAREPRPPAPGRAGARRPSARPHLLRRPVDRPRHVRGVPTPRTKKHFEPVPFGELGVRLLVDSPDVATRAALEREIRAALAAEAPR
jgi:hypothetical protein